MNMLYSQLSSQVDDGEALLVEFKERHETTELKSPKPKLRIFSLWTLHLILFSISFTLLVVSYWTFDRFQRPERVAGRDDDGYERIYSPLWEVVRYEKRVFYSDVEAGQKFMGQPRPELDEAWASITDGGLIMLNRTGLDALGANATEATNVDGRYLALPEYIHQMHCLDIVRKSYFREYYKDFGLFRQPEAHIWGHIDHCIDVFRRNIMCNVDVGLLVFHWEGPDRFPVAEYATEHMCRNWDAVNDFVHKIAFDESSQGKSGAAEK